MTVLSIDQELVFEKYMLGENVFLTGPGGVGKSELIKNIVKHARFQGKSIQVCALTGCAAVLLQCEAKTIHSWAGIGLCNADDDILVTRVMCNSYKKKKWQQIDILIVDEVSMMSIKMFEVLNCIAMRCRKSYMVFGGIQVIFSGDFFQLPPVGNISDERTTEFCFTSTLWNKVFKNQMVLTTMFRQTDPLYSKILNQVRCGMISRNSLKILSQLVNRTIITNEGITPTVLSPVISKVTCINMQSLKLIDSESYYFNIEKCVSSDFELTHKQYEIHSQFNSRDIERELDYLYNTVNCNQRLELKKGAQVMCIVNLVMEGVLQICNGSIGIIIDFDKGYPIVKFNNGLIQTMKHHIWTSENIPGIGVKQIPLILAWALTIHKSQGCTLDCAEIDIGIDVFECGQTYVALSRVKSLEGLYLSYFDHSKIKVNKKVVDFYKLMNC
jgi:ATP-dependent DNA helicase PIF1